MSATTTPWADVTPADPCLICGKPDRCKVSPKGDLVMCRRVESVRPAKGGEAWLHPHPHGSPVPAPRPPRPPKPAKPAGTRDWGRLAAAYAASLKAHPARRRELADSLGLPAEALDALPLVGWNDTFPPFWSFPEANAAGAVVGITRRFLDPGRKKMQCDGGKRGLVEPAGWRGRWGPVHVVEGASDVLAATHAGLACVGRFNNTGGADLLAELFAGLDPGRVVVVHGENDRKENGDWPGRDGAVAVAAKLRAALPGRDVRAALPGDGIKDARAWLTHPDRAGVPWLDRGALFAASLVPLPLPADAAEDGDKVGKKPTPSPADLLAGIAAEADLFHDDSGQAYATVGRRTLPVESTLFKMYLANEYRKRVGKVVGSDAIGTAIFMTQSAAVCDGPEGPVSVRVGGHAGKVYYHLGDDAATVIEIDADGWRACPDPPVRFVKQPGMLAVPTPEPGGDFADIRRFLNCPDAATFALLRGWVSTVLNPSGGYPVLGVTGEQGSAKSFTTVLLKQLLDPAAPPTRSGPRDERDLVIMARRAWVLAFDNLSGLPEWLSNAFCRLSTGGGFGTRKLHTDGDEVVFSGKRPLILNGIDDPATNADLLQRMIILRHPAIPEGRRRLEADLLAEFEAARPKLLGAVFDRVSAGLRALPSVDKSKLPRMADACTFAVACERGMGEDEAFVRAFSTSQSDGHELALSDSPVVEPLLDFMLGRREWCGSPTELHDELSRQFTGPPPRDWPKRPNAFTNKLRRVVPSLRETHGLHVNADVRTGNAGRARLIRVARSAEAARGETPDDVDGPEWTVRTVLDGQSDARPSTEKTSNTGQKHDSAARVDGVDDPSPVEGEEKEKTAKPAGSRRYRPDDRAEVLR